MKITAIALVALLLSASVARGQARSNQDPPQRGEERRGQTEVVVWG